ncbi:MAG: archease [Candidatus Aureabacteria bacterium]|nr:archease [Candidatus Auribacterota bacterium]
MPYRYLDHIGDAAIEATGNTLEEAFSEAARAMCALMAPGAAIEPNARVKISVRAATRGDLLIAFLNELLAQQGLRGLIFTGCRVKKIERDSSGGHLLRGEAEGVAPGSVQGRMGPEVKAASYAGLKVEERAGGCTIRCVLDM